MGDGPGCGGGDTCSGRLLRYGGNWVARFLLDREIGEVILGRDGFASGFSLMRRSCYG